MVAPRALSRANDSSSGRLGVERACGLVRQHQTRPRHRGARGRHALALPARHLEGMLFQHLLDAKRPRRLKNARVYLAGRHALDGERERDVLVGRERVQQVRVLEHKAKVVPAKIAERPAAQVGDRAPSHDDLPARGRVDGGQAVQKRRLARTRRPHDPHELALGNREAHPIKRLRDAGVRAPASPRAVALAHVAHLHHRGRALRRMPHAPSPFASVPLFALRSRSRTLRPWRAFLAIALRNVGRKGVGRPRGSPLERRPAAHASFFGEKSPKSEAPGAFSCHLEALRSVSV